MGEDQNPRIPVRLYIAVTISLLTLPLPLALSKGNFFHNITIYDRHWFLFALAYIGGTAGAILLTGSAHLKINDAQQALRGKRLVWFAYLVAGFCFISMHILRIFFRGAFDYLESLI